MSVTLMPLKPGLGGNSRDFGDHRGNLADHFTVNAVSPFFCHVAQYLRFQLQIIEGDNQ
jgi:hypothetical protein